VGYPTITTCGGTRSMTGARPTFRLNDGDVKRHTMERLASLLTASFGPRITYKELTA